MASLAPLAAVPQSTHRTKCQDFADPTPKHCRRKPSIDSSDSSSTDAGSTSEPSLRGGSKHSSSADCWEAWDDVFFSSSSPDDDDDASPSTCREAKDFDYVEDGGPSFAFGPGEDDDDYAVDSDPVVSDLHSSFTQHTTTTSKSWVNGVDSDPVVAELHSSFIQHTTTKPTSLVNGHSTCHNVPRPLRLGLMGKTTVLIL